MKLAFISILALLSKQIEETVDASGYFEQLAQKLTTKTVNWLDQLDLEAVVLEIASDDFCQIKNSAVKEVVYCCSSQVVFVICPLTDQVRSLGIIYRSVFWFISMFVLQLLHALSRVLEVVVASVMAQSASRLRPLLNETEWTLLCMSAWMGGYEEVKTFPASSRWEAVA